MKKIFRYYALALLLSTVAISAVLMVADSDKAFAASVKDDGLIKAGVYAGDISLEGLSGEDAEKKITKYVGELSKTPVVLSAVGDNTVEVTAEEMGLYWKNKEIAQEAEALGREGNIVKRFKTLKDLERENKRYDIILGVDESKIKSLINERCVQFNQEAIDATLERVNGEFNVIPGQDGLVVDVDASVETVQTYMETLWNRGPAEIQLEVAVEQPRGKTEELEQVKDIIGTYTTSFKTSAKGRSANVRNGCSLINDTLLYPGEQLSVYEKVSPFSEENGYYLAGSYNNGLVVETLGGGICQVSSTLYNAVIRAELQVDQRSNHSMVVSYVDLSADAAISGTEKDFKFTNSTNYPIYIVGSTTEDKQITFTIYGKEERPENRKLEFETETISETVPEGEKVVGDSGQPVGYSTSQSAHTGYKANYWKIVKVDGVETERVQLNSSYYMPAPTTVTFGTSGDVTGAMASAIATQNSEYCRAVAAQLVNAANSANIAAAEQAAMQAAEQAMD